MARFKQFREKTAMPLPMSLARTNRRITNRIARPLAGRIPPFAIIEHRGRKSGKVFRTPIMVFHKPAGFVIALTYGETADWVQNILTAGTAALEYGGRQIPVSEPHISRDPTIRQSLPFPVRSILRLIGCDQFLIVRSS